MATFDSYDQLLITRGIQTLGDSQVPKVGSISKKIWPLFSGLERQFLTHTHIEIYRFRGVVRSTDQYVRDCLKNAVSGNPLVNQISRLEFAICGVYSFVRHTQISYQVDYIVA